MPGKHERVNLSVINRNSIKVKIERPLYVLTAVLFLVSCNLLWKVPCHAAVYDASTLHDAVSRSETVQELFFARWNTIREKTACFDLYGIINWVPGYMIKSYNSGNGQYQDVDMTLVRTYGSVTVGYPLLKGYNFEGVKKIFSTPTGQAEAESAEKEKMKPAREETDPFLAFTASGFHYGLTRSVEVNRGSAGTESISDYKYSQFFDDIFALSFIWNPWVCLHGGIILNREIMPKDDGTMDYSDAVSSRMRYIGSIEIYSLLTLQTTSAKNEMEAFGLSLKLTTLSGMFFNMDRTYIPEVIFAWKALRRFNDQPWESVWVQNQYVDGAKRHRAYLHTFDIAVQSRGLEPWTIECGTGFQYINKPIIDRRTKETIDVPALRKADLSFGYDLFNGDKGRHVIFSIGASRFWDPAIPIHRDGGTGYGLYGWNTSLKGSFYLLEAELKLSRNDARELHKLVEASDHLVLEGRLSLML